MGISQRLFDIIPNISISNKKVLRKLNKIGDVLGQPMPNRLIMGATAIVTQPFIDRYNKRVDDDTAKASCNRTIGKILAGTLVGCIVRGAVFKLVGKTTNTDIKNHRWDNLLTPRNIIRINPQFLKNRMRNYKTVYATIMSLLIMLITNFAIDMPLTNLISNFLNRKSQNTQQLKQPPTPVQLKDPKERIKEKFNINKGGNS